MLIIGLTGGIGSGKSAAAEIFAELGVPVIDTDIIAHELTRPGQPAVEEIAARLGRDVLSVNGDLDRDRLRRLVFQDPQKRLQLEQILHPRILDEVDRRIHRLNAPYCIVVIPLLFEKNLQARVDRTLVIDCPESLQRERVLQRPEMDPTQVDAILRSQLTREARRERADDIVTNTTDLDTLRQQIMGLHARYSALDRA